MDEETTSDQKDIHDCWRWCSIQESQHLLLIKQWIILEQTNSFTSLNVVSIIIPSWDSDEMSNSNSIINRHSPISLSLYISDSHHIPWLKIEKEDLINQSSLSFILFITNSFHSTVLPSPHRVCDPRVMDWSRIRSHSSVIQSFILSNTIEWQQLNTYQPNWMDIREGRFFNSSDS